MSEVFKCTDKFFILMLFSKVVLLTAIYCTLLFIIGNKCGFSLFFSQFVTVLAKIFVQWHCKFATLFHRPDALFLMCYFWLALMTVYVSKLRFDVFWFTGDVVSFTSSHTSRK